MKCLKINRTRLFVWTMIHGGWLLRGIRRTRVYITFPEAGWCMDQTPSRCRLGNYFWEVAYWDTYQPRSMLWLMLGALARSTILCRYLTIKILLKCCLIVKYWDISMHNHLKQFMYNQTFYFLSSESCLMLAPHQMFFYILVFFHIKLYSLVPSFFLSRFFFL